MDPSTSLSESDRSIVVSCTSASGGREECMATDGNVRCLRGRTLWEAVRTSRGNGRATQKSPPRGPGRAGAATVLAGGRAESARVSTPGIIVRVWARLGMRGTWAQGTLMIESSQCGCSPCSSTFPSGAKLVCRLPLSGYRGAFSSPRETPKSSDCVG